MDTPCPFCKKPHLNHTNVHSCGASRLRIRKLRGSDTGTARDGFRALMRWEGIRAIGILPLFLEMIPPAYNSQDSNLVGSRLVHELYAYSPCRQSAVIQTRQYTRIRKGEPETIWRTYRHIRLLDCGDQYTKAIIPWPIIRGALKENLCLIDASVNHLVTCEKDPWNSLYSL